MPRRDKQPERPISCQLTFKYGKAIKTFDGMLRKDQLSLYFLYTQAMTLFSIPGGTRGLDVRLEVDGTTTWEIRSKSGLYRLLKKGEPQTIVVLTTQRPFSSWTFEEFKMQFGVSAASYTDLHRFELPRVPITGSVLAEIDHTVKEVSRKLSVSRR